MAAHHQTLAEFLGLKSSHYWCQLSQLFIQKQRRLTVSATPRIQKAQSHKQQLAHQSILKQSSRTFVHPSHPFRPTSGISIPVDQRLDPRRIVLRASGSTPSQQPRAIPLRSSSASISFSVFYECWSNGLTQIFVNSGRSWLFRSAF